MKERPILFSGEMVRAILDGRKTMTRRVIKDPICTNKVIYADAGLTWYGNYGLRKPCPYGEAGDRLWVKESHYAFGHWEHVGQTKTGKKKWKFVYNSKLICFKPPQFGFLKSMCKDDPSYPQWYKRNSLFMPKWAARIWLERTETRVESLVDISEEDAKAEGIEQDENKLFKCYNPKAGWLAIGDPVESYKTLWDSINGMVSWYDNPWVWVIEFKKVEVAK